MTHPNSIDLEAFACGEAREVIASHLATCDACRAFVDRMKTALGAGPSRARAAELVARAASLPAAAEPRSNVVSLVERRKWLLAAATVVVPLVAAAVLLLVLQPRPAPRPVAVVQPTATEPTSEPLALRSPPVQFKGGLQVAIVRERGGDQARFTGSVSVRPDDRLRVEVALDHDEAILAGVLGDDGSWLELMASETKAPGTYFSDRSARVDASPLRGTVLVGPPAAVNLARATRHFDGVATVRIEWEAP